MNGPREAGPPRAIRVLTLAALVVVGCRAVDDAFLQRPHGVEVGDHVLSGLVPVLGLAVAAWAAPHLSGAVARTACFSSRVSSAWSAGWSSSPRPVRCLAGSRPTT